eukprot:12326488-Prorocentrum_lima.AAC.1
MTSSLVGSEMCIRDRLISRLRELRHNCAGKGYVVSDEIAMDDFLGSLGLDEVTLDNLQVHMRTCTTWAAMVAKIKDYFRGKYVGGKKEADKAREKQKEKEKVEGAAAAGVSVPKVKGNQWGGQPSNGYGPP